ncbi:alpha/beta-hydrolase N-terminal domain-containing protein [Nocardia spumae]|uniref:alpha/beta-hydrolase N-terminal domain-containing protein n=1 Tax=Nocardia spumae TaxID=2887190 RepID=UPI001D1450AB|nr:alpha/beta-hydrolase N-terminal domain-containing protein [Nocardia spumae]
MTTVTAVSPATADRPDQPSKNPDPRRHRPILTRPRIDTVAAVTAAVVVSLLPAVLPRTSVSQAIMTGVPVAFAIGIVALVRMVLGRWRIDVDARFGRHRVPVLLICGFVATATAVRAAAWQNGMHAAMGMAPAGAGYWLRCLLGSALIVVLLVGTGRGLRWGVRTLVRL